MMARSCAAASTKKEANSETAFPVLFQAILLSRGIEPFYFSFITNIETCIYIVSE